MNPIIDKIRKLQALATSSNVHEAAAAAAMAQKLIERHKIEAHLLNDIEQKPATDQPIIDRVIHTFDGPIVTTWVLTLASGICAVNGVKAYYRKGVTTSPADVVCPVETCRAPYHSPCVDEDGDEMDKWHSPRFKKVRKEFKEGRMAAAGKGTISGIGTADDLDVSEVMVNFIAAEIERFHDEERPRGLDKPTAKTWGLSFRNGAVLTVIDRLQQAQKAVRLEMENEARIADHKAGGGTFALARVQAAIVHVGDRLNRAEEYTKKNLKLKAGGKRTAGSDAEAFAAGRAAGKKIDLEGHKRPRLGTDDTNHFKKEV